MSDVLKPYVDAAFASQVNKLISEFIHLYNRYSGWATAIQDFYNAQVAHNPAQPWTGAAATQINTQVSTLAAYAPSRLDLSGKNDSNLQKTLDSLRALIRHMEDTCAEYEHSGGWFSPANLDDVAAGHNTNKDYARYILSVLHDDFSHPYPIDAILQSGQVNHETGWQPEDPQNQNLDYREQIRSVLANWANAMHTVFDSWLGGSNSGTGHNMRDLTRDLMQGRNGIPPIHQETFGPYMTNAQLYDFIALGEVKSNVQDKVGFTPVKLKGGGDAVLITLPGTQLGVNGQVNDINDAINAASNRSTDYLILVEDYIANYVKQHPGTHFILAGHSYGGMVAQQVLEDSKNRNLGFTIDEVITYGSPYVYKEGQNLGGVLPPPEIPIPHHMYYNADDIVTTGAQIFINPWDKEYETQVDNPLPFNPTNAIQSHDYSGSKQLLDTTVDFTIAPGGTQYYNLNMPATSPVPPPNGPTPTPGIGTPQPVPVPGPTQPTPGPTPAT